ncbi:histidinol-phosphate phosphatase family domain-containing protein/HAD-superfamily hydrolase, subfamily IIIA [Micromonospora saelicesensis]|uniref:D,D-heptose 1,7-bisphosphate phosphatase n=1 Tax=Micromonospora saelicesensis TaxID=285676 RepID=A0A1C4XWB5_9ACTN|nr:histidinol-phosphate phosphatase family domain-containing protein/HAD-superfamily hydrolase, subfamily IIIA [Micromonospora saelicesensis]
MYAAADRAAGSVASPRAVLYDAVLLDRDGTLIEDVPYNGDPEKVRPVPGARAALDRLRAAGLRLAVVTNQSGLARGYFTGEQMWAVHARVEELLGRFDAWLVCPHDDADGCDCRKPAPGLVYAAARELGTTPSRCVLVGDIGRDVGAAMAAGAAGVLVPTPVTRPEEVAAAGWVATDLPAAVAEILRRQQAVQPSTPPTEPVRTALVVRSDSAGDVLVTGPAIRAVAAGAERVVLLCGPRGRAAANLLPGVDEIIEHPLPWIDPAPGPVDPEAMRSLSTRLGAVGADQAVVFTSFHQSALPLALLLRMAGINRIAAISDDYPGSLLDIRHRVPVGVPEPERALSLAAAAGHRLPDGDEPVLRLRRDAVPPRPADVGDPGYVVLHPGSAASSRACPPEVATRIVGALADAGHRVLVTGGPDERAVTARVAAAGGTDLGGRTDLAGLAAIVADASAVVVGNTGPAHLAAAAGVPVVSLFAPTVPFGQWGPYRVPTVRLGDAAAPCRDTRAARCPVPGHPCLSGVDPGDVVNALRTLAVSGGGGR